MQRGLSKFGVVCSLALGTLAMAQVPAQPTSSAVALVSAEPKTTSNTQPDNTQPAETSTKSAIHVEPAETDGMMDPASLLPDLPPAPTAHTTLVGGTIQKLDRVRDQITISVFGGGRMKVLFDPRTHIVQGNGQGDALATAADLKLGQRVAVDTVLEGTTVFARSIRLKTTQSAGETQGSVVAYSAARGELTLRDALSPAPVRVRITSATKLMQGEKTIAAGLLVPGALVAVTFDPGGKGQGVAREISVLALPGASFTFAGRIIELDLSKGLLVLISSNDHKTYEIYLDPKFAPPDDLKPGAMANVVTNFDGSRYVAHEITVAAGQ